MTSCPSIDELNQLLSGKLDARSRPDLARHIDACDRCQRQLDELTYYPYLETHGAPDVNANAPSDPALSSLMARLRNLPPDLVGHSVPLVSASGEPDPTAPLSFADFRLGDQIGKGGMGSVYRAVQISLNKSVAIKLLSDAGTSNEQLVARFLKEARAAASLRHPNIVDVHGIGRTPEGGYFLVMDLVEGADLQQLTAAGETLALEPATIVATVADAIDHAHQQGVIHRDLKPGNVLLSTDGEIFVTDFGVAKILGSDASTLSAYGQPIGTPSYMAPEQADPRRDPVGPAADVYGLGGVLYYLLTGQHPYLRGNGSEVAVLAQVLSDAPPVRPRDINSGVSSALEDICLRCLKKRPSERFNSAKELAEALRSIDANHEPDGTTCLRIALLHKRNAEPDSGIVEMLERELSAAGHSVFVDRELSVDIQWAHEIDRQIYEADVVIPLLSEASVSSEMLAYEVQLAWQATNERAGKPRILPVRINYDGELPSEVSRNVEGLPKHRWTGPDDDTRLVNSLKQGFNSNEELPAAQRLSRMEPPMGAVPLDSEFYLVREADALYEGALSRRDSIVLVRGARQMGKTSLMARGLKQARDAGTHVALTDFQKLNASDLASAESLFLAIGDWLAEKLDLDTSPHDTWNARRGASVNFERFLRREVLAKLDAPLVWGLDEIDRLFTCDFSSEVFGLFRSWHNERALDPAGPWSQLTLAIAYATEAHLFITDINQSPFNVGTRISLNDLSFSQVSDLNRRYHSPLASEDEVEQFVNLVGGQPYLVNRSLYEMTQRNWGVTEFADQAASDEGVFGDHLRRIIVLLAQDNPLCDALRRFIRRGESLSMEQFYRLRSAGVIAGDSTANCKPRCGLYKTYLERSL
ncbi:MAG: AAA-like domain-containing protein [Planctomycetes bacterium]|nr:AAA-like domain-containing protein [Planctomycetota bacterium]